MGRKIAIVGSWRGRRLCRGAYGPAGEDVTFIDPWPEHVEHMREHGLRVTHAMDVPEFTVPVRALHVTDAQQLGKEAPVDIAFVCMKSYDTAWATMLIKQYLAPDGYVVSLQNCMNEETIAGIVGWGKTLGCIASVSPSICPSPATSTAAPARAARRTRCFAPARCMAASRRVRRRSAAWSPTPTAPRSPPICGASAGPSWSPTSWRNGLSACTGLPGGEMLKSDPIRRFSTRLGSEAIRVGQAYGYQLEEILHLPPETIARAGEGDVAAMTACDEQRFKDSKKTSSEQRPSMGQDMQKGRRTEIEFLTALWRASAKSSGSPAPPTRF